MNQTNLNTGPGGASGAGILARVAGWLKKLVGFYNGAVPIATGIVFVVVVWRAGLIWQLWTYLWPQGVTTKNLTLTLQPVRGGDLAKLQAQIPGGLAFAQDGTPLTKMSASSLGYLVNFRATVVGICACQVYYSMQDADTVEVITGTTPVGNITALGKASTAALQFFVAEPRASDGSYLKHSLRLTLTIDWPKPPDQNVGETDAMLPPFAGGTT